jgi:hypothetical protein
MSGQAYVGATQRTFRSAVLHELETQYGLLGSQRVLSLLAEDIERLVRAFFPTPEHLQSGWMIYTGVKASGPKATPGQSATARELVTLAWPVLLAEDIQYLASHGDTRAVRKTWNQQRLTRLLAYGYAHPRGPVLLTEADLAALLNWDTVQVSQALQEIRQRTGEPCLTVGYYFDQGMRPTHKTEVITRYEHGMDEAEIARQTQHTPGSVGHYIRDYERVRLLLKRAIPVAQIGSLTGLLPNVIEAYAALAFQFHPDLKPNPAAQAS